MEKQLTKVVNMGHSVEITLNETEEVTLYF